MPRDGAITFRDIAGKLTMLRVRRGGYQVARLVERYGIDG
jgi:hypothetical protein